MKTIRMFSVALTVVCAFAALSATAATAHEWRNFKGPLTKAMEVQATGPLTFENRAWGYKIQCTVHEMGTVGPGAHSEITSIKSTTGSTEIPCEHVEGGYCTTAAHITTSSKLPWASELVSVGSEVRNSLVGEPEWKVTCEGGYSAFKDWCGVTPSSGLKNYFEDKVEVIFEEKSPATYCFNTANKGKTFFTAGTLKFEAIPSTSGLSYK
jgi:hypothetical protein